MTSKQVMLLRQDLKLPKGKAATQVAHASVDAVLKTSKGKIIAWKLSGMKKIVLKVKDLRELKQYQQKAKRGRLTTALITDAGKTFFKKPTITCLAIGPDSESEIDEITKNLKML